jgi:hypothetical protein
MVVEKLKVYITMKEQEKKIEQTDYLFGIPTIDEKGNLDGNLHYRKTHKAIVFLYNQIKAKQRYNETGKFESSIFVTDEKELEQEMKEKRIIFYSLRHTFNTLCVLYRYNDTNIDRSDDLIDYFMGHKINNAMRAKYSRINNINNKVFLKDYGKFVMDILNKYIFYSDEENKSLEEHNQKRINSAIDKNQYLFKDGRINRDDALKVLQETLNRKPAESDNQDDDDDLFISV